MRLDAVVTSSLPNRCIGYGDAVVHDEFSRITGNMNQTPSIVIRLVELVILSVNGQR